MQSQFLVPATITQKERVNYESKAKDDFVYLSLH